MGWSAVGKYDKYVINEEGHIIVSFEFSGADRANARRVIENAKKASLASKKLVIDVSIERKKRSLNANAYFHLLVGKIAEKMNLGSDEVKVRMVLEYGAMMVDDGGGNVGIKLPSSVNVANIYPYAKWFDKRHEGGKDFDCYIIYKQTHTLDSAEMERLIDGVVYEASELDIETKTPDELASMMSTWEASCEG